MFPSTLRASRDRTQRGYSACEKRGCASKQGVLTQGALSTRRVRAEVHSLRVHIVIRHNGRRIWNATSLLVYAPQWIPTIEIFLSSTRFRASCEKVNKVLAHKKITLGTPSQSVLPRTRPRLPAPSTLYTSASLVHEVRHAHCKIYDRAHLE